MVQQYNFISHIPPVDPSPGTLSLPRTSEHHGVGHEGGAVQEALLLVQVELRAVRQVVPPCGHVEGGRLQAKDRRGSEEHGTGLLL